LINIFLKLTNYIFPEQPVKCVIVYDFPVKEDCAEAEFLYQISLAGYVEHNVGVSHLLYTDRDLPRAQELIDIMNELKQV
jgi:hypothetical protein